MTRLVREDIMDIEKAIGDYDRTFRAQTGHTMAETARIAVGLTGPYRDLRTAVVPVTQGQGIIPGFSQSLRAILTHCGVSAEVTGRTDVGGLQDAFAGRYSMVFAADDDVFSAFTLHGDSVSSDNGAATGRGFAAALILAMKKRGVGPAQRILVLGAGPVGCAAARYIRECGGTPCICDIDLRREKEAVKNVKGAVALHGIVRISDYPYIVDATTSGGFITADDVTEKTIIAAPGMPCGVTDEARRIAEVIHNPLELGTMTMYYSCLKQLQDIQDINNLKEADSGKTVRIA